MTEKWHVCIVGEWLGPVSVAELSELASQGILGPTDLIRRDGTSGPQLAQSLVALFDAAEDSGGLPDTLEPAVTMNVDSRLSAAQPARDKLRGASGAAFAILQRMQDEIQGDSEHHLRKDVGTEIEDETEADVLQTLSAVKTAQSRSAQDTHSISRVSRSLVWIGLNIKRLALLLAMGGVASAAVAWTLWQPLEERAFALLDDIRIQADALRIQGASGANWDRFRAEALARTEAVVGELEQTASAEHPVRLQLLWAARDQLPRILSSASTESADYVDGGQKFKVHLENAAIMKSGAAMAGPLGMPMGTRSERLLVVVVIADMILILTGLNWCVRKWQSTRA